MIMMMIMKMKVLVEVMKMKLLVEVMKGEEAVAMAMESTGLFLEGLPLHQLLLKFLGWCHLCQLMGK